MPRFIVLFLLTLVFCPAFAQTENTDSLAIEMRQDSLTNAKLRETAALLERTESLRLADSIKRKEMELQIASLKSQDSLQIERLEAEIASISRKDSAARTSQKLYIDSLRSITKGVPVMPFGDTLFFVYAGLGPFTPRDRVENIEKKIKSLAEANSFSVDSLQVFEHEQNTEIMYLQTPILSITPFDAIWMETDGMSLAKSYKAIIEESVKAERSENSIQKIIIRISLVLLVIVVIYFLIKYINKLFNFLQRKTIALKGEYFNGFKIRNYEFLDQERQLSVVFFTLKAVRLLVILLSIYIALPVLFSIFPWTEGLANTLFGYFLTPVKKMVMAIINFIPNLITIIVIYVATSYAVRFIRFLAEEIETGALSIPGFYKDWSKTTYNIIRFLLYAFMFVVIFPYLPGSDSDVFKGVSVFVGVLFSIGSSSAIANMVAGLVITYMRPFQIGDRIKVGEIVGDVIEKNLLVTRIRTIKNEKITVPNSNILGNHSVNYTSSAEEVGLILNTSVTIGYDVPWRKVHELLITAAKNTDGVFTEREPFVLQTSLDDFYVSYQLNAYTKQPRSMATIYSDLHQNIQDEFAAGNVEIMSPHYRAERDGSDITIPKGEMKPKQEDETP